MRVFQSHKTLFKKLFQPILQWLKGRLFSHQVNNIKSLFLICRTYFLKYYVTVCLTLLIFVSVHISFIAEAMQTLFRFFSFFLYLFFSRSFLLISDVTLSFSFLLTFLFFFFAYLPFLFSSF